MVMRHAFPPGTYEVAPPNTRGVWIAERDFSLLDKIAAGLSASVPDDSPEAYVSIPDVWAHTVVFEQALLAPSNGPPGSAHPLRDRAIALWRGLIALLALKPRRMLPVDVRPLTWHGPDQFAKVARDLLPLSTVDPNCNWQDHLAVITFNSAPVGLLVPSTIVCPTRGGEAAFTTDVPWFKDGQLGDPLADGVRIDQTELVSLAETVRRLAERLRSLAPPAGVPSAKEEIRRERIDILLGLLTNFSSALMTRAGQINACIFREKDSGYTFPGWSGASIFSVFAMHYEPDNSAVPAMSPLYLPVRHEFREWLSDALLLDPSAARSLAGTAVQTPVWSVYKLADLAENPRLIPIIKRDAASAGILALTPDELFTPTICRFNDASIAGHGLFTSLASYILPFTPQILFFLSPANLLDAVTINEGAGEVVVELRLPLGRDAIPHIVRRVYRGAEVDVRQRPPSLAIWPNFKAAEWESYYVFAAERAQSIRPTMAVATKTMADAIKEGPPRIRVAEAMRFGQQAPVSAERWMWSGGARSIERLTVAPEAMLCSITQQKGASDLPVGLLLLPAYDDPMPSSATWRFGIDLGSTNTTVFVDKGGQLEEVTLHANFMRAFSDESQIETLELWNDFMSVDDQAMPFLTVLYDRNSHSHIHQQPLLTSHIVFSRNHLEQTLHRFCNEDEVGKARFNLKWGATREARQDVMVFLSQVMLQCLAEAAREGVSPRNVQWSFAYPEAFHSEQFDHLRAAQERALAFATQGTASEEAITKSRLSESLATALCFHLAHPVVFHETAITFDVGGETTDVTIWQNKTLVWQSSLRIGGKSLFVRYLMDSPVFLDRLAQNDASLAAAIAIRSGGCKKKDLNPEELHEVIINSAAYERAFKERHWAIADEPYSRVLRDSLSFTLGGLLFYVGKAVALLATHGRFDLSRDTVTLCFGGRGSLAFSKFVSAAYLERVQTLFDEGAGHKFHHHGILYSDKPKTEVAMGLLCPTGDLTTTRPSPPLIPLGEEVLLGHAHYPMDAGRDLTELDTEKPWRVAQLTQLREFHDRYCARLPEPLPFEPGHEKELLMHVNHGLEEDKKGARDVVRSENLMVAQPPFILALRERAKQIVKLRLSP